MLEQSKNRGIQKAYRRIIESQNSPQREYAYHCTNVNPSEILKHGFRSTPENGFTLDNAFEALYQRYLPENPCFVSRTPWKDDVKYLLKIDITGLEKYADLGSLVDSGAYYEELDDGDMLFYWEEKDLLKPSPQMPQPLLALLDTDVEEERGILDSRDFDGERSFALLGSCAVDGDMLTPDRIKVVGRVDDVGESADGGGKKNWPMIRAHNKKIAFERGRDIVPAELADCLEYDRSAHSMTIGGKARSKIGAALESSYGKTDGYTIVCSPSDDGKRLVVDFMLYPLREGDSRPLNALLGFLSDHAPWIASHRTRLEHDRHMSFVRFELQDKTVVGAMNSLLGRPSPPRHVEQLTFGL